MRTTTKTVQITVEKIHCGHWVALPEDEYKRMRETGATFYCSYGHPAVYRRTENQRLQDELQEAQTLVNRLQSEKASLGSMLDASQARLNSERQRVRNGVCPNCRRSFLNLKRHMASKHKESL